MQSERGFMNLIVATDRRWGIGKDGKLPWHLSEDLKYFKRMTTGKVIIMGRKTLESFPHSKPLPNRINIVLTHQPDYEVDNAVVVHNIEELFSSVANYDTKDIFVVGGASIYELLIDYCDTAYVTRIDKVFDTDTKFLNLNNMPCWEIISESEKLYQDDCNFKFCIYKRSLIE